MRLLDIIFASLGLIVLAPIIVAFAILCWLDTRSPFFRQERVGRDQKPFTLVKFRTMNVGTASVASHLASLSSITPLGHFMRRTKIDELPQLWNVLIGDMSLVGPRPCLPNQQDVISEREIRGVFASRPGITGRAQLNDIDMSMPVKLAEADAQMISELGVKQYTGLILQTLRGKGSGDRVTR